MRFNMTQQHVGLELDACASSINELDARNLVDNMYPPPHMTHTQHLKADGNAVASILVFGLPVLGILLLPAFRGFEGVHNKVQLLGGIRDVAAAVPGLEIIKCIFELLALPNQLLQRVRVRLA
jgi:hypothetical protein